MSAKTKFYNSTVREPIGSLAHKVKNITNLEEVENRLFNGFKVKTLSFEHQLRAVFIGAVRKTWLFALDMGLGKTKIALDIFSVRKHKNEVKRALIVCPPIVLLHWKKEIKQHSYLECSIIMGTAEAKLVSLIRSKKELVVISHNSFRSILSRASKDIHLDKTMKNLIKQFDMLIVDEAHLIRNPSTKGFKMYKRYLCNIPHRYLFTGTPVGNKYQSVWSLYFILNKGHTYGTGYSKFLKDWFFKIRLGRSFLAVKWVLKKASEDKFFALFWSKAIRWEENECNDLPPKTYIKAEGELTRKQIVSYTKCVHSNNGNINQLMRITAGMEDEDSFKLKYLYDIVQESVVDNGKKLIIWHWLSDEGELINNFLKRKFKTVKIGQCRGAIPQSTVKNNLTLWHNGALDILVANPRSIGIGVDLVESSIAVFFSNNYSVIDRKQAEKRIHRTGQTSKCIYIDLICRNTIDGVILSSLHSNLKNINKLTKDALLFNIAKEQWKK